MSSGLPDYLGGIRPRYGGAEDSSGFKVVTANDQTILTTISGKGMIYGGVLRVGPASNQKNSAIWVYVDDEKLSVDSFGSLNLWGMTKEHCYPVYLIMYDDVNLAYAVGISHGITFETSLQLMYSEVYGSTPIVTYRVIYALV